METSIYVSDKIRKNYKKLTLNEILEEDDTQTYPITGSKVDIYVRSQKSKSWIDDINRANGGHDIISLNDNSNQYISLKDYNDYRKNDFWLFYIVWLGFVGYFIRWVITNSRTNIN